MSDQLLNHAIAVTAYSLAIKLISLTGIWRDVKELTRLLSSMYLRRSLGRPRVIGMLGLYRSMQVGTMISAAATATYSFSVSILYLV